MERAITYSQIEDLDFMMMTNHKMKTMKERAERQPPEMKTLMSILKERLLLTSLMQDLRITLKYLKIFLNKATSRLCIQFAQ